MDEYEGTLRKESWPRVFRITPGGLRYIWFVVPVLGGLAAVLALAKLAFAPVIVIAAAAFLAYSVSGSHLARFEVSPEGLRLRGDFYGRRIPADKLRGSAAEVLNLAADRQREPVWRTWGTAVPGYQAGWFKLHNGEKALLYVTNESRVAYVPTTDGYSVMVSVDDPETFVNTIREIAKAP